MSDTNAIPVGSGGSQPVAWAVTPNGRDEEIDCEFVYQSAATAGDVALGCNGVVLPLVRPVPPANTLTDEEREAIELAAGDYRYHQDAGGRAQHIRTTLLGLLERLK